MCTDLASSLALDVGKVVLARFCLKPVFLNISLHPNIHQLPVLTMMLILDKDASWWGSSESWGKGMI